jgi:hypothetical protein
VLRLSRTAARLRSRLGLDLGQVALELTQVVELRRWLWREVPARAALRKLIQLRIAGDVEIHDLGAVPVVVVVQHGCGPGLLVQPARCRFAVTLSILPD